MVIQISPQTEPSQASLVTPGAESQQQKSASEKGGLGVFARILAGLQGKTVTDTATEAHDVALPVEAAEHGELGFLDGFDEAENGFLSVGMFVEGLTKTVGMEHNLETMEIDLPLPSLFEAEFPEQGSDFSQTDILAGLSGEHARQISENGDTSYPQAREALTDTLNTAKGEPVADKHLTAGTVAAQTQAQAMESAEKPRNAGENARTGTATQANATVAAVGAAGEGLKMQAEAAKAPTYGDYKGRAAEVSVRDLRRGYAAEARDYRNAEPVNRDGLANANTGESRPATEGSGKDVLIEMRMPNHNAGSSAVTSWEGRSGQALENMLARELHQNLNGDIVRHASIILREGTDGVIRLALKPESLGNVKIHLEMAENKITGYIVVESEEALRAFERELASLEKEFRDSGFEGAELKMSLSDGKGADQQSGEAEDGRFLPGRIAADSYDASAELAEMALAQGLYWQGSGAVDMLA